MNIKITDVNSPLTSVLDRYPANLHRSFTFKYDVFIAGAERPLLQEKVLPGSSSTAEAVGGIHIIL